MEKRCRIIEGLTKEPKSDHSPKKEKSVKCQILVRILRQQAVRWKRMRNEKRDKIVKVMAIICILSPKIEKIFWNGKKI